MTAPSIEQGNFILTLMPSLRCELNCPHCYLSLEQRRSASILPLVDLQLVCERVDEYYRSTGVERKNIVCYWYGGEPTTMGMPYVQGAIQRINTVFATAHGYSVRHIILTSLIGVGPEWYRLFKANCDGYVQSSYDGLMRGAGYLRKWEESAKAVVASGLRLATISVVNQALLDQGPVKTLDYLSDLGIVETSWLPFMWNEQNSTGAYDRYAPTMDAYSDFMIGLTTHHQRRREAGLPVPMIGQQQFILTQGQLDAYANIAGQTLFLLPNGDYALPDYQNGYQEYLRVFGNALQQPFASILRSPGRRAYLRKQLLRNDNPECQSCEHSARCVMEFWKTNRPGECFGAKRYVEWVVRRAPDPVLYSRSEARLS